MRRPRRALVNEFLAMLIAAVGAAGCGHMDSESGIPIDRYHAADIDLTSATIRGQKISTLLDRQVRLTGLARSSSGGSAVMYLVQDKSEVDTGSYRNCINLIVDNRLRFNSPVASRYTFTGKFLLLGRLDPTIVYLTYKGIRFDTDCQSLSQLGEYPYFVVTGFESDGEQ